ncbi:hypothetical protein [Nocardia sp. NPDC057440]|uniref:hypothetical protein n=1 Tax=Nocardia sp. NPDC057440 TaxID=3346134 RepID=UPI003671939A
MTDRVPNTFEPSSVVVSIRRSAVRVVAEDEPDVSRPIAGGAVAYTPKTLFSDLCVGESPRWRDNRLWFGNWGAAPEIVATDRDGKTEVVARGPKREMNSS